MPERRLLPTLSTSELAMLRVMHSEGPYCFVACRDRGAALDLVKRGYAVETAPWEFAITGAGCDVLRSPWLHSRRTWHPIEALG